MRRAITHRRHRTTTVLALSCGLAWPGLALAQSSNPTKASANAPQSETADVGAAAPSAEPESATRPAGMAYDSWKKLRERTVSASDLMHADVRSGPPLLGQPLGKVRDLVLDEAATSVEYVLYEVPYPYSLYGAANGFVAFDAAKIDDSGVGFGVEIRFERESDARAPEELTLNRAQADRRLVSKLMDERVAFADDQTREIEDVLIDRKTGKVTSLIVNENPEAFFNDRPLRLPLERVSIGENGALTAGVQLSSLEAIELD